MVSYYRAFAPKSEAVKYMDYRATLKIGLEVKVGHCAGHISANTRLHQLPWGDREIGTAISCTECSQVADFIQKKLLEIAISSCSPIVLHLKIVQQSALPPS